MLALGWSVHSLLSASEKFVTPTAIEKRYYKQDFYVVWKHYDTW